MTGFPFSEAEADAFAVVHLFELRRVAKRLGVHFVSLKLHWRFPVGHSFLAEFAPLEAPTFASRLHCPMNTARKEKR